MSKYMSSRDKVKEYYSRSVYPALFKDNLGLDYNKFIDQIVIETGVSDKLVREYIQTLIRSGQLVYEKIETIAIDPKIKKEQLKKEVEAQEELKKEINKVIPKSKIIFKSRGGKKK